MLERISSARIVFAALLLGLAAACAAPVQAEEARPQRWEQLFYPFPIVGAPPQLEQQVQFFGSYFTGAAGSAFQPSAELGYVAAAHLGLVATVPSQSGAGGQPTGLGDAGLLIQYLAAGSLAQDDMLSVGIQSTFRTGAPRLTSGDYFVGPFAYGAKRFRKRFILEANAATLLPVSHRDSAGQVLLDGLASYLCDPGREFPVYAQTEVTGNLFFSGIPTPAQTAAIAPEIFLGPFDGPFGDGTRLAAGVFFNLTGDPAHRRTYSLTVAFDLPNRFGY